MQLVTFQECNLSRFRNASKGVVCAQTSVSFRNAIKSSCFSVYKKYMHLRKFVISSGCGGASGLIVATSRWPKTVMRARKKEQGD